MRGLKTRESLKFNRYWKLVQDAAAEMDRVFFGFAGEGRDFETLTMEGEDFSGWLVPVKEADTFEQDWHEHSDMEFLEYNYPNAKFMFAIWCADQHGSIFVSFKEF